VGGCDVLFIVIPFRSRKGVADDRDGTQAHRGAGNDRAEQQAEERVQHPRRHRNTQRVVEKGEEQVLPDVAHGGAAEADGLGNAAQVAFHEGDARALHGHVGAGAHGDADFRFAEGGRVVDAVAGHRNVFAFGAQFLDMGDFAGGFDLRFHRIEAELLGHRGGGAAVVAGEHDELQAERVEFRMASAVVDLIGSATARIPAGLPSMATNIAVLPSS
jgi:hypothetical protein